MSEQQINQIMQELGYMKGLMEGMTKKLESVCDSNEENSKEINILKSKISNYEGRIATYAALGGVILAIAYMVIDKVISKYI